MTSLGPGDPATWPPYSGHPNDPRGDSSPADDLDTVHANDSRCPVCGGCGWTGRAEIRGRLHLHSPGESSRDHVAFRDLENRTTSRPSDLDMEDFGMEVCPVCDGEGHHPEAVCRSRGCSEREAVIRHGELTGLCPDHWIEIEREEAAIDAHESRI